LKHALRECRGLLAAAACRGLSKPCEGRQSERTGEGDACRPLAPRPEPVGHKRAADEIALGEIASKREGEVARGAILDADRDGRQAIVAGELDERSHLGQSPRILGGAAHDGSRDLQLVELRGERPSGRVSDADPVERDTRARRGQTRCCRPRRGGREGLRTELEGDHTGSERSKRFH